MISLLTQLMHMILPVAWFLYSLPTVFPFLFIALLDSSQSDFSYAYEQLNLQGLTEAIDMNLQMKQIEANRITSSYPCPGP